MAAPKGSSAQKRAREEFLSALETASRIYAPAREMCKYSYESFNETDFHPNVAAKIIGLAFLCAFTAWEDFLSSTYLGYMCGYPAPSGLCPRTRFGKAANKSYALLLAAGECTPNEAERHMKWSQYKWVKNLSKIHFYSDNPYNGISEQDIKWLDYAVSIRNRVAHNSDKAKSQFKNAVNHIASERKDTPLPPGFSPGQLLTTFLANIHPNHELNSDDHHWGDLFEGYLSLWSRLADEICPPSPQNA